MFSRRGFVASTVGALSAGLGGLSSAIEIELDLPPDVKKRCQVFLDTYPGVIQSFRKDNQGVIRAILSSGAEIPVEDFSTEETFEERLENPDLLDMISDPYPLDLTMETWPVNLDPGRYRNDELLKAAYGQTEAEVRKNLVAVDLCGHKVMFNQRNGAAEALGRVSAKLKSLLESDPKLKPYLAQLGGGFAWRKIAGTSRLSGHSYAMAIDLNPKLGGYWRWDIKADRSDMRRRRNYPQSIIEAFESEKFIWGGKWYHFDLMHFEYRPELFSGG